MADTPSTHLATLVRELTALRPGFDTFDDYYEGRPPLVREPERLTSNYRELLEMSTSNWCRLVVDVVAERLVVDKITSSRAQQSDDNAWGWWQANNLDAYSGNIHREALKYGVTYVGVAPDPRGGAPLIRGQVPTQVHVRYDEEDGAVALDAVKLWVGRDRHVYATLYTPELIYRFISEAQLPAPRRDEVFSPVPAARVLAAYSWVPRTPAVERNTLGAVPFVRFACQPDLSGGYTSEIEPIMNIQRRINKTTFDRMLASEFTAFPQRWATGMDIPVDDEGNPVETLDAAIDRVWTATSPDTTFGQFPPGQMTPYLEAEQSDVQALATQSRTPPHYLTGGMGTFPSGESVRATEYGLSRKVRDRQMIFGEAWAEVLRLAAVAAGDEDLAKDDALDVKWADVEARSEGERVDALLKMSTLGVPRTVLWERWGATPQEVGRWDEEFDREQARMADLGYTTTVGPSPVNAAPPPPPDTGGSGGTSNSPKPTDPRATATPGTARASGF